MDSLPLYHLGSPIASHCFLRYNTILLSPHLCKYSSNHLKHQPWSCLQGFLLSLYPVPPSPTVLTVPVTYYTFITFFFHRTTDLSLFCFQVALPSRRWTPTGKFLIHLGPITPAECWHTGAQGSVWWHEWENEGLFLTSSAQFSCSVMSDSLRPHELQHTRPSCPSPTPGVHSNSCPSSQWCHPQTFHPLLSPSPPAPNPSQH